jgi:hypothetical protein
VDRHAVRSHGYFPPSAAWRCPTSPARRRTASPLRKGVPKTSANLNQASGTSRQGAYSTGYRQCGATHLQRLRALATLRGTPVDPPRDNMSRGRVSARHGPTLVS